MANILIVDDEYMTVEMLATFLRLIGHDTTEALTARQAWDQLELKLPDAVLLDIMLPDQNGLEVCQELRKKPEFADLPVIIISAAAPPLIAEAKEAGASEYLAKPISLAILKEKLRSVGVG
ncbi:MAG: response regulator [Anaerolineae bacterium]|nr:response regulator [Anaerolineae bacterium]